MITNSIKNYIFILITIFLFFFSIIHFFFFFFIFWSSKYIKGKVREFDKEIKENERQGNDKILEEKRQSGDEIKEYTLMLSLPLILQIFRLSFIHFYYHLFHLSYCHCLHYYLHHLVTLTPFIFHLLTPKITTIDLIWSFIIVTNVNFGIIIKKLTKDLIYYNSFKWEMHKRRTITNRQIQDFSAIDDF